MVRMPWSLSLCHPCASIYLRIFKCLCVHLAAYIQVHALTHALRMHAIVSLSACHPSPSRVRVRERERARARASERASEIPSPCHTSPSRVHTLTHARRREGGGRMYDIYTCDTRTFIQGERKRARATAPEREERERPRRTPYAECPGDSPVPISAQLPRDR